MTVGLFLTRARYSNALMNLICLDNGFSSLVDRPALSIPSYFSQYRRLFLRVGLFCREVNLRHPSRDDEYAADQLHRGKMLMEQDEPQDRSHDRFLVGDGRQLACKKNP